MSDTEIEALRAEVARLTERLDELAHKPSAPVDDHAPSGELGVTRRNWVKAAAAAAVGGSAAVVAGARPVAAAAGDEVVAGQNNTTDVRTRLDYTGGQAGVGTLIQSGESYDGTTADHPAALGGFTDDIAQPNGVFGFTDVEPVTDAVAGVVGKATASFASGVAGYSDQGSALVGRGGTYGLDVTGDRAAILVTPSSFDFPSALTDFHNGGELYARAATDSGLAVELWYCTVGGEPGEWVQIAGPGQPGGFRAVQPSRVYDSRVAAPLPGRISGGEERTLDITRARNLTTGESLGTVVPTTATALAFNIAVVGTSVGGFLSVAPTFSSEVSAATINWSETGQVLNNGSVTSLAFDGQVKVFAGGAGSTDFVIDVTGYWS